ncbi:putative fatty acyl-CoA reductase CG8306 isoform X1 [Musca autumnalis]|uniref:putative fatty acyl-CoA reductase CG8306 isoform X1 n=1 Tax=Musca autumnalis TaxID=221902 RepID=UPI003CEE5E61
MDISDFYNNREIFITGGTGFLGKSLIEKLLRDCPGIKTIYMLIRTKRGKTALERLEDFKNDIVFERVRRERPNVFEKVVPIFGDCQHLGLAISQEDLERLKNVSIIFHEAAVVRFDNDLRSSILMNTRGTFELVKIAQTLKQLIAFVHCSTAYIYPLDNVIEEKIYKLPNDWRKAIQIAETYDEETLEVLRLKYTNFYPNAYSFTKNLGEQVIADHSHLLPMTILRPAIVASAYLEPEPGYLENLNGPMGILAVKSMGISQMTYANPDLILSLIPVDIVTCLTISSGCRSGLETLSKPKNVPYNLHIQTFAPGKLFNSTIKQSVHKMVELARENPMENTVWAPATRLTTSMYCYLIWVFLFHIPMGIFYDTLLKLSKKQPMLLKATRRIIYTIRTIGKFSKIYYEIKNDGMFEVFDFMMQHDEKRRFYIMAPTEVDHDFAFRGALRGLKKFIFKEPVEATAATRQRVKILIILDKIVSFVLFFIVIKFAWNWTMSLVGVM